MRLELANGQIPRLEQPSQLVTVTHRSEHLRLIDSAHGKLPSERLDAILSHLHSLADLRAAQSRLNRSTPHTGVRRSLRRGELGDRVRVWRSHAHPSISIAPGSLSRQYRALARRAARSRSAASASATTPVTTECSAAKSLTDSQRSP